MSRYITTPIYYVNDQPHIGHAYTTLAADTLARWYRLEGEVVRFLTGVDEHGEKNEQAARARGITPQQHVDEMSERYRKLWTRLGIGYNDFIRTTEPRHKRAVQRLWKMLEAGRPPGARSDTDTNIYLGDYSDWYCVPCETFWTETQLVKGKCPTCGRDVEKLAEKSFFFRLSAYRDELLRLMDVAGDGNSRARGLVIRPETRANEVRSFLTGQDLRDLSISRTTFSWGIPVPADTPGAANHVIYVWIDALTNYITALGWPDDADELYEAFWSNENAHVTHFIGKDILRFHTVYWPAMLSAAKLLPPRLRVFAHGWWTIEGEKMSKSKGNFVDPRDYLDEFGDVLGADLLRYFLLREIPFGNDGDFARSAFNTRINGDLANDLGNLFSRVAQMIGKYCDGKTPHTGAPTDLEAALIESFDTTRSPVIRDMRAHLDDLRFSLAYERLWEAIRSVNKYLDTTAPWTLAKEGKEERLRTVLYTCAEALRLTALYVSPILPNAAQAMWERLGQHGKIEEARLAKAGTWGQLAPGTPVAKGAALFPRIETKK